MNFPFYIARRYLFSKKSHNIINVISFISVLGVCIVSLALIVVLSVFNGFEDVVIKMYNSFNPDLEIKINKGKTFDESVIDNIKNVEGVAWITKVVEENALLEYKGRQHIATIKGVSPEFSKTSTIDTAIIEGDFILEKDNRNYAVAGQGIAYFLDIRLSDFIEPLKVYVPKRDINFSLSPDKAFNNASIFPSGIFSVQQEFDTKYLIVPLQFARKIMDYSSEVTSLEIALHKNVDKKKVQQEIQKILGNDFSVKDRFQQQALLYKIMKTEKWAIFLILTFILIIATTGIIGSLIMLIVDKKDDIAVLMSMGTPIKIIKRVFITEGLMIVGIGALTGIILGTLLCLLQMKYGFVKLGTTGTFVIDAYPVKIKIIDFIFSIFTILLIGFISICIPVSRISPKYIDKQL